MKKQNLQSDDPIGSSVFLFESNMYLFNSVDKRDREQHPEEKHGRKKSMAIVARHWIYVFVNCLFAIVEM